MLLFPGPTDFAGCTLLYLDGAEVHRLGVEGEQSVGKQIAYTEEVLQSLCCLDGSEHSGDGTQNACLATGRNSACWRWLLEEATVTCCAWEMGKGLSLESQDAAMGEWLAQAHAGIIDVNFTGKLSVQSMMKSHGLMISSALSEARKVW